MHILAERYGGHWQVDNLPHSGSKFADKGDLAASFFFKRGVDWLLDKVFYTALLHGCVAGTDRIKVKIRISKAVIIV